MTACCYSCVQWKLAPKKLPIDVLRREVCKQRMRISSESWGEVIEVPVYGYEIADKSTEQLVSDEGKLKPKGLRFCLLKGRLVKAWWHCEDFKPRFEREKLCYAQRCPFEGECEQLRAGYG